MDEVLFKAETDSSSFWHDHLSDFTPTEIFSTGTESDVGVRREYLGLDEATAGALKAIATDLGVSLKSVLLAVHVRAVGLLAGETDVVTGVVTDGRPVAQRGNKVVSLFSNSVPLRQACGGGSWRELVESLATQEQAYWPHRRYPMPQLQRELNAESLFKHLFNYTHFRVYGEGNNADHMLRGVEDVAQAEAVGFEHSNYPLTIQAGQYGDGSDVYFALEADLNHYSHADFDRMMSVYQALMSSLIADVDSRYEQVDVLADQVSRYLPWEGTDAGYDLDQDLVSRFGAMVEAHGDRVALTDGSRHLTYAQLWSESNAAGSRIASLGVSLGDRVGVSFGRSIEFVVTMLGVLKAGGSYVPLDPDYPQERLDYLIADAGIQVVIASDEVADDWPVDAGSLFELLSWSELQEMAQTPSWEPVARSLLSETYQMYTSGSTGLPKGVCAHDQGVLRVTRAQNYIEILPEDVVLQLSSVAFDGSTFDIWGALLHGSCLALAQPGKPSIQSLTDDIDRYGVSVVFMTTALFHVMVKESIEAFRGLRVLLAGGEKMSITQLQQYLAFCSKWGGTFVHCYGPTEATTYSHCDVMHSWDDAWLTAPIGYPISHSTGYVLDQHLNRVPVGVPGELYVGGSGLAHGYWGRPGLTASHFIPNPYRDGGDRLYKTGDRVRYLEDGRIEFLGRVDHQVKIRGHRIEPGEIEDAIRGLSGVQDAAVTVIEASDSRRLVAYVAGSVSIDEVGSHLKERLPSYMVPYHYESVESIPLTLNGKIDYGRLPAPNWDGTGAYVAPQTEAEHTLCEIWSEVLGVESVGVTDNFFELGGDSILSIQIVGMAVDQNIPIEVSDLFQFSNIRELLESKQLSEAIEEKAAEDDQDKSGNDSSLLTQSDISSLPDGVEDAYPVGFTQLGMLYHSDRDRAVSMYHDIIPQKIHLKLQAKLLKKSIEKSVRRHSVLRTAFELSEYSQPLQLVYSEVPVDFEEVNSLEQWTKEQKAQGFDWRKPSLIRFGVEDCGDSFALGISVHHAIIDGWSLTQLTKEIVTDYQLTLTGEERDLPALRTQFREFVELENDAINDEAARNYWVTRLQSGEIAEVHGVPHDVSTGISRRALQFTAQSSDAIKKIAKDLSVSIKSVLLAVHVRAIGMLSGESDVVTGVVTNGRPETLDGEKLIGLFLNSVPVRQDCGTGRWRDLVVSLAKQEQAYWPHRRYPMPQLQRELNTESLFNHLFNYTHFHVYGEDQLKAVIERNISSETDIFEQSNFPLTVQAGQQGNGSELYMIVEFDRSYYGKNDQSRISEVYQSLLEHLAANADGYYEAIELASEVQQRAAYLSRRQEYAVTEDLISRLQSIVEASPEAEASSCGDERLSYAQLWSRSNQLAHYLMARGVEAGERVGLCFAPGNSVVIGMLGILKAGGVYVPLDPAHVSDRLSNIVQDAALRFVVGSSESVGAWSDGVERVCLDDAADQPQTEVARTRSGDYGAYVIYTSGSTGVPNGVEVNDRHVLRLFSACEESFGFDRETVWSVFHSIAFDFSVWEIWGALLYGGRMVFVPAEVKRSPERLHRLLAQESVTLLSQTPSAFYALLDYWLWQGAELPSLSHIVFGGEALDLSRLEAWYSSSRASGTELVNMYGITETTVHVTHRVLSASDVEGGSVIGEPLGDLEVFLLDDKGHPVVAGARGEICVGGSGLAHGYLNRPGLTASRYVPHPYRNGERLYRSGDLGRYVSTGELEYCGRIDTQVKVRGHRIELGEIEAVVRQSSGVSDARVVLRERSGGERYLAAYVIADGALDRVSLRQHLNSRLPSYMVPACYVPLGTIPLTLNGKLDQKSLPEPQGEDWATDAEAYVAPETEAERTLCAIWSEVLGVERIGVHDNYFALGGDSLLSLQIAAQAEQAGFGFSLEDLFDSQTVGELCARISMGATRGLDAVETSAFSLVDDAIRTQLPDGVVDAYPAGFTQLGMLYHSDRDQSVSMYHDIILHTVYLPLDLAALHSSLTQLIARHSILRTAFSFVDYGESLQLVYESAPVELESVANLPDWMEDEKARGFDWEKPGLIRFGVVDRGDYFEFGISIHHAIIDGWSVTSFVSDLVSDYSKRLVGKESALPELASSYRDYIALEQSALRRVETQAYWQDLLSGHSTSEVLPAERATGEGIQREFLKVTPELSEQLKDLSALWGVSLKSILLAVHVRAISMLSGESDVVTGVVTNGRPETLDGEKLVGLFLNTVPVRQDCSGSQWHDLVASLAKQEQTYWPHRRYPMPQLQRELDSESLFRHLFNYTHFRLYGEGDIAQTVLRGVQGLPQVEAVGFEHSNFPLTVQAGQQGNGSELYMIIEFDRSYYGQNDQSRISEVYQSLLEHLAANADGYYEAIELESEVQQRAAYLSRRQEYAVTEDLISRLQSIVEASPEAEASSCGDERLSYAQLWSRSNQLAHYLMARGVEAGERVGLCFAPGNSVVIGMLGILKAGGVYVPLDPAHVSDRLSNIVQDAALRFVVGSSESVGAWSDGVERVCLDDAADQPQTEVARTRSGDYGAYVIYTSGSTGVPNGVEVNDRHVLRLFSACEESFGFDRETVWSVFHSIAFDFSVWEIWGALLYGGRMVFVPAEVKRSPERLHRLLAQESVTLLSQTPSAFYALLDYWLWQGAELPSLSHIVFGGEALDLSRLEAWYSSSRASGTELVNMYGITETTVHVTHRVLSASDVEGGSVIGEPLGDLEVFLLDDKGHPVVAGARGEICVGGSGLAHGYLNRPGLTASRYVPHPYRNGERLYRSGDLGRYVSTGELEYCGRIDTQVKVRGHRIELGEIEAVVRQSSGVSDARVVLRERSGGERYLAAYVIADGALDRVSLRQHLNSRLPSYMVPACYVPLGTIPLTLNGKLDQKSLPEPQGEDWATDAEAYVAPETEAERTLCAIWSEVLGVERIGVHDNYFALGGDSLLSLQIAAQAEQAGFGFSLEDLFDSQTVGELCARISMGATRGLDAVETSAFSLVDDAIRTQLPDGVVDAYPAGFTQLGMLYHSDRDQSVSMYHDIILHTVYLPLDLAALHSSLTQLIARHSILRTAFSFVDYGESLQLVYESAPVELESVANLPDWMEDEKARGFDWEKPGLIRFGVVDRGDYFEFGISIHHAISDGWSITVLATNLVESYSNQLAGKGAELPVLASSYRDYIALEQSALRQVDTRDYWQGLLSGHSTSEVLPTETAEGEGIYREFLDVTPEMSGQLKQLAGSWGVSLKSVLLAVHVRAISMLSGESDVVTGVVTNGRPETLDGEKLVGLFLNSVPVRQDCSGGRWRDLVDSMAKQEQAYWPHRRYPMPQLQRELNTEALFEHLFNYTHFRLYGESDNSRLLWKGLENYDDVAGFEHSNFPLTVQAGQQGNGSELYMIVEFDRSYYGKNDQSRISEVYQSLLEHLAANADGYYEAIELASEVQQRAAYLSRRQEYAVTEDLISRLQSIVEASPEAEASSCGDERLSYAQLWSRSNQLAHYLMARGVEAGERVGLCFAPGNSVVIGMLGILKAGGVYVPLDPAHVSDRLSNIVQDAALRFVVGSSESVGAWSDGVERVCLDDAADQPQTEVARTRSGDYGAYVIYTSGSTGVPNGVEVNDRHVLRLFSACEESFGFDRETVWSVFHSIAFDFSVWEIWGALLYGGRMVFVPAEVKRSPERLHRLLAQESVTLLSQTPSAFYALLDYWLWQGAELPSLSHIVFGGEALDLSRLEAWYSSSRASGTELVNMYGITETTVHVTHRVLSASDVEGGSVIGEPLGDLEVFLLDDKGHPVVAGARGEICVGGSGLAHGYLNRPGLTASRYVPHPYRNGERLYRSGDLGRYVSTGELEYCGRIDTQVKVRGHRIELGEIEAVVRQSSGVSDARVVLRERSGGERYLAAYVIADGALDRVSLRQHLNSRLPSYMVPACYVPLGTIPLTLNGKLDQKSLPEPQGEDWATDAEAYVAPETEAERTLCAIWSEVLGVERIGVHDNYFALGGDSLLSLQIAAQAEQAGFGFSLEDLFDSQTVGELCARISMGATRGLDAVETSAFSLVDDAIRDQLPDGVTDAFPVSGLQQSMLYNQAQDSSVYNDVIHYWIHGEVDVDVDALQAAGRHVFSQHEVFRLSFDLESYEEPMQLLCSEVEWPVEVRHYRRNLSEADCAAAIQQWQTEALSSGINLSQAPVARLVFHVFSDSLFVVSLQAHHAILDGWSESLLIAQIMQTYAELLSGRSPSLRSPNLSYRDFVALERRTIEAEESRQFWISQLAKLSTAKLPEPAGSSELAYPDMRVVTIDRSLSNELQAFARREGVALKYVLLAAHMKALSVLLQSCDVVSGVVLNGRLERAGGEEHIGMFLNSLPFRLNLSGHNWGSLARACMDHERSLFPHRRMPLSNIQALIGRRELFQVAFNYVHFSQAWSEDKERTLSLIKREGSAISSLSFLMTFMLNPENSQVEGFFQFPGGVGWESYANASVDLYQEILRSIVSTDAKTEIGQLDLVSANESCQIAQWEGMDEGYNLDPDLISRFGSMVAAHADRVALTNGSQNLTYAQLWSESTAIGSRIVSLGVAPGDRVGVSFDRSIEFIVTMLGVLKAGGSYVPLDPDYPQDRLDYLIADSGIQVVIASDEIAKDWSVGTESRFTVLSWSELQGVASPPSWEPVARSLFSETYIMYTSGSTGQPKGVCAHDRAVLRVTRAQNYVEIHPEDVVLQLSSIAFDGSTFDIWGALLHGGCLALARPGKPSVDSLADDFSRYGVSVVFVTTALFHVMVKENIEALQSLRLLLVGGEKMSVPQLQQFLTSGSEWGGTFAHCYGPTEATTFNYVETMSGWDDTLLAAPIGYPICHSTGYVLDQHLNRVPVGATGELYLGGAGLAHGYWGRPGLTATQFIPNPYGKDGSRLYKTGDRVRYLEDGRVEFIGRVDQQVKIRGHRIEPGEIEAVLSAHPTVKVCLVDVLEVSGSKRLVAYVVGRDDTQTDAELRRELLDTLKARLPAYMVPTGLLVIEEMPLTINGKVDRARLPAFDASELAQEYVVPVTDTERKLQALWASVLKLPVEKLGVTSNFYELGGDSILAIQLVSRTRKAGLNCTVKQLTDSLTVRALAEVIDAAQTDESVKPADQGDVEGEQGLLPIHSEFFANDVDRHHFNQSMLVAVPSGFRVSYLRALVRALVQRHDALRLRYRESSEGSWSGVYEELNEAFLDRCVAHYASSELDAVAQDIQESFSLEAGGLFRVALFSDAEGDSACSSSDRLLFVFHHLLIDGVSWRIVFSDAEQILDQFNAGTASVSGEGLVLPPKTHSYQSWADYLSEYAQSESMQGEQAYWQAQLSGGGSIQTEVTGQSGFEILTLEWDEDTTRRLLSEAPKAYRTQVNELLLTAVLRGVQAWSGQRDVLLKLEGHGRESRSSGLVLDETVGWFTSAYPLRLSCSDESDALSDWLCDVKEDYRSIPNKGLGYGVLRYLKGVPELALSSRESGCSLLFNYLGQFDSSVGEDTYFKRLDTYRGEEGSRRRGITHPISLNGQVNNGRLVFWLSYERSCFSDESMQTLKGCLEAGLSEVVEHCCEMDTAVFTPSDFALSRDAITPRELSVWQSERVIEDIYPATPMQQGLIYHTSLDSSAYVTQSMFTVSGVSADVIQQAWEKVVSQYVICRTSFVLSESGAYQQLVHRSVEMPFTTHDLSNLNSDTQNEAFEEARGRDKLKGFDVGRAPLMRCSVWKITDNTYRLIWSHHHTLLDGWSLPLFFEKWFRAMVACLDAVDIDFEPEIPYRNYIAWLQEQDREMSLRYWEDMLSGITEGTSLPEERTHAKPGISRVNAALEQATTVALKDIARKTQVTMNTILQAAWGIILARYSNKTKVVFGTTISGRPANLEGVEQIVGLMINTIPSVIEMPDKNIGIEAWLKQINAAQSARLEHGYLSMQEIQQCASLTSGESLFDSLLVYENYPIDVYESISQSERIRFNDFESHEGNNFGVTLVAREEGQELKLELQYQNDRFGEAMMRRLMGHLELVLKQFVNK